MDGTSTPEAFSLHRMAAIATIAAAFGVVALFNQTLTDLARGLFGFYGAMVFGGLFQCPGILAYALIQRRWVAFAAQNLFGLAQLALGNPLGLLVLSFTFAEAVAQEAVLRPTPTRLAGDWRIWALAGIASWFAAQIPNYFLFGLGDMPLWAWLLPIIVVGIPSSVIFPVAICTTARRILPASIRERLSG